MNLTISKKVIFGIYLAILLVTIFCFYSIFNDIRVRQSTGLVKVSSPEKQAVITISQEGHQAAFLGTGSGSAHLKPGHYLVIASNNGKQISRTVNISKKRTSELSLDPNQASLFPSIVNVNFLGMANLVKMGISAAQASKIELALFKYRPSAHQIYINTEASQTKRNVVNNSSQFTVNFGISIDSDSYKATLTYSSIDDINLQVFNTSGVMIISSSS